MNKNIRLKQKLGNISYKIYTISIRKLIDSQYRDFLRFKKNGILFKPELPMFPLMVLIETTNRCNLTCNHCPNSVLSKDKSWIGDIDPVLYRKIIDEIAEENVNTIVRPFDGGEPLCRNDIEDLIFYTKKKGIKYVSMTTNGHLLNKNRARKIIESKLDNLEISIDATTPETYKKIRNSDRFNNLIENVLTFLELKKEFKSDITVSVSFVKQKDNLHEEKDFIDYWKNRVNNVLIRPYHQHGNLVDEHGTYEKDTVENRYPCPYLWRRLIVHHNGLVRFCESDWKANYIIGDARRNTLKEIWNSEEYNLLRRTHIDKKFNHPFCKNCTDWKVLNWY